MTGVELRAAMKRLRLTQGAFATKLGVSRPTLNEWINGAHPISTMAQLLIPYVLAEGPSKPAIRRKRNLLLPRVLRAKRCPRCGSDRWFDSSLGTRRKGVGIIYIARCKAHLQNRSACSLTSIVFDTKVDCGWQIEGAKAYTDWCCRVPTMVSQGRRCVAKGQTGYPSKG
jgi:DNA-binding transcriptional regulator YdaS (Cro superfamily)